MKMSFFGKLKNINPPAPPRRTGNNEDFGWKQHGIWQEDEEEEGDMYEVPPCERPAATVPLRQVEENVYMERTSSVGVPQQRLAAPASRLNGKPQKPQHAKESTAKKPPEVDRNEKPGRKMMTPPPAAFLTSTMEEDVYLDPNEEQGDNDNLYLEPAAACPPPPLGPIRMSSSTKTSLTPLPIMKPPVPRANSNSFLHSMTEVKTAPNFEARPVTSKLSPSTAGFKPPLPTSVKETMLSHANPHMLDTKHATYSGGGRATKQSGNEGKEWFAGDCNRKTAEDLLLSVNKDGTFLIRHNSAQNPRQPFTLAVLYQQKVYNIPVRFLDEMQGFALGKEGKKSEEVFTSLDEMVTHHKKNQLYLIDSKSQAKHAVHLSNPARC
ncbi:B-cell linker protein isoform X1 [Phyllopteryx taeniolatus]|uniref:B-cell linker protein isoform X1 n=1 Tax=Phyllopteryx taeniolatus TaxID=161469 RepID=UPI002AD3863D|nr:B-cell linker protein isoform X1 [Phyllopteryx taeniolatus]